MTSTEVNAFDTNHALPSLVIRAPSCSHCGNDVSFTDDIPHCGTCLVAWDDLDEGAIATPDPDLEDSDTPCGRVSSDRHLNPEYDHSGKHWSLGSYRPCILPTKHGGFCRHPYTVTSTPLKGA